MEDLYRDPPAPTSVDEAAFLCWSVSFDPVNGQIKLEISCQE